jgi:hypothetical protein
MRIRTRMANMLTDIARWLDGGPTMHIWPVDEHNISISGSLTRNVVVHGGVTARDLLLIDNGEVRVPLKDLEAAKK